MGTTGIERLVLGLEAAGERSLRRTRHAIATPQGPRIRAGGRELLNFSSNDYLGLANHPVVREAAKRSIDEHGVGAGASPLVSGYLDIHREAEERFARFVDLPRALLFASGYAANLGILGALADRSAEIFADKLNHACLTDGAQLSRATFTRYPHGDMEALEQRLRESKCALRIVATDTVFSMDGDVAPLARLLELCEAHDAWLVLDDAHGIGVLGDRGHGALEHAALRSPRIVYMATLGKALGGYGAFVAGEAGLVDWLVQRARTYIYSTALPPMAAGAAIAALDLIDDEPARVRSLHERIAQFRALCANAGIPLGESQTAIQPLPLGDAQRALEIASRLNDAGFLVPAIRPPTVPEGTSRLRVSLSAAHRAEDVQALVDAIAAALRP